MGTGGAREGIMSPEKMFSPEQLMYHFIFPLLQYLTISSPLTVDHHRHAHISRHGGNLTKRWRNVIRKTNGLM